MKKLLLFIIAVITLPLLVNSACTSRSEGAVEVKTAKIMVYYFHYERRCATCLAVEEETRNSLNALYPELVKKGQIVFQSINLEEKAGEALADKLKVAGQSLIIVDGAKITDLTEKGFLYAKSEPAKLKAEIKKAIDPIVK